MKTVLVAAFAVAFLNGFIAMAQPPELRANQWVRLADRVEPCYEWSAPLWVPARGQLLHWGGSFGKGGSPNDVRAFDSANCTWISDYESDPPSGLMAPSYKGAGSMLASGRPRPAHVLYGGCWDSKRNRLVYTMKGLMVAYDPATKTWQDMGARTVMPWPVSYVTDSIVSTNETPGGPPVYGVGTCYDPHNDEIILFSHFDAKDITMREITGRIKGHYGTFRYSFADNTWRPVSDTFGSEPVRSIRQALTNTMGHVSAAMDILWVARRHPTPEGIKAATGHLTQGALIRKAMGKWSAEINPSVELLTNAERLLADGKIDDAIAALRRALWALEEILDVALRVDPPARNAASMVYDPRNHCIVMFGGQTPLARPDIGAGLTYSGLDDTWLYDVQTRQWREISSTQRPPRQRIPLMAYDPESGLVLLVTISGNVWDRKVPRTVALWTLDVAKGKWSKRNEQTWPGEIVTYSGGGSEGPKAQMPMDMFGFDPKARLLVVMQPFKGGQVASAMRLDLAALPVIEIASVDPMPPLPPFEPDLTDDAAWVERLRNLPANTWVAAKPPQEAARRDWGTISVDPVRGCLVYFGGGHSSYQCNDVAIYGVGANRWFTGSGEHNGHVPNNEWEGTTLGHRGGPPTGHQRNTYQAFDGRMYLFYNTTDKLPGNYVFHADPGYARFYDIDRGGVWRDQKIATIESPDKVPPHLYVSLTDPKGRLFSLIGEIPHYYAPNITRYFVSKYELDSDRVVTCEVPKPFPEQRGLGEGRPYCYAPDRNEIIIMGGKPQDPGMNFSPDTKKIPLNQVTFAYDVAANSFRELPARRIPPVQAIQVVEYCEPQGCLLAVIGDTQWLYSFKHGNWVELPLQAAEGQMRFQKPYGQMGWVEKYGVFVNFSGATWVMRPDLSQISWD